MFEPLENIHPNTVLRLAEGIGFHELNPRSFELNRCLPKYSVSARERSRVMDEISSRVSSIEYTHSYFVSRSASIETDGAVYAMEENAFRVIKDSVLLPVTKESLEQKIGLEITNSLLNLGFFTELRT